MRNLIILLLVFSSLVCEANVRDSIPNGLPQQLWAGFVQTNKQIVNDSGTIYKLNDTASKVKSGYAAIKFFTDHKPYYWDGTGWKPFAAPSTSFVKYSDSTTIFVTPTQLGDSGFVKLLDSLTVFVTPTQLGDSNFLIHADSNTVFVTPTQLSDSLIWKRTGNNVYPKSINYNVGIGTIPSAQFDVLNSSGGRITFDGVRFALYDNVSGGNILIGSGAGGSNLVTQNIGIGGIALKNVTGSNNVSVGYGNLSSFGTANRNVAFGVRAMQLSNGSDGVAIGYQANVSALGDSNTAVGNDAATAVIINATDISNSEIVIGTNTYVGTDVASWITANSLVIGQRYVVLLTFNGAIPSPFTSTSTYANAQIINSNTVQFDISLFTSQGTSTTTFSLYNKQHNSIAIGYHANTPASNTTAIGNSATIMTYLGGGALDIPTSTTPTPASGHAVLWFDGTSVKLTKNVSGTTTTTTIF